MKPVVVFANQRGEPIAVLDDGLLGANLDENPRPLDRFDAIHYHRDAADVPVGRPSPGTSL